MLSNRVTTLLPCIGGDNKNLREIYKVHNNDDCQIQRFMKYERCHCQKIVFLCGATFSGHVCQCVTKSFCLPKISIIMKAVKKVWKDGVIALYFIP